MIQDATEIRSLPAKCHDRPRTKQETFPTNAVSSCADSERLFKPDKPKPTAGAIFSRADTLPACRTISTHVIPRQPTEFQVCQVPPVDCLVADARRRAGPA
jgi:hypothetical protein